MGNATSKVSLCKQEVRSSLLGIDIAVIETIK
jgi:hypothetical protein